MTPISEWNMARLRVVEAELDQMHGLLRLAKSELDATEVAVEFMRLNRLVALASQQASTVVEMVTERTI